ncbi:hybrid sensor histidine kinase/response regulator [Montanilutibacter psychrotolerans]|uniref:Sensory/regulatory protein RpfC n=1 Tax=Montanilutibacter psychrotolerans TaxID=1327343 RepID=A0A3M8SXT7_9GAMM|nr:ATP-binding protein [Lysobacter psychrotolerans]RNF83660.1 response regulator [Lysobacter psychrotolerans]
MRRWLDSLGTRHQLLALFGLFLLAGLSVLVIDEMAQYRARESLLTMKNESLQRLRRIKAISDAYGLDVVDTTFRVRNHLVSWEQGVRTVDAARVRIDREWVALAAMPRNRQQQAMFDELRAARGPADRAAVQLRAILVRQDIATLGRFADTALFPAIDPVTSRFQRLSDLAMLEADALVSADLARNRRVSALRIGLTLLTLAMVALLGRAVLRNAYRGIESLTWLVKRMRAHDYVAAPTFHPRGELGTVMDAFIDMRGSVLRFETRLTDHLIHTERLREELEHREAFQRSLLNAAQTAILTVDAQGVFTQLNPFAERLLGRSAAELIGRQPLHAVFATETLEELAAALRLARGQAVPADWNALRMLAEDQAAPREALLRNADGRSVPSLLAVSAMHGDDGELHGLLVVAADLSMLKRLERKLRESEARAQAANVAKSSFLAAMSHEIRTPMIGVTGMVEILSHTELAPEQRHALNVIQQSSQSLLRIIGDILDFSKIEAGRLELSPEVASLPSLVRSTAANYSGSASSKGLELVCRIDERIAAAHYADALRLRQILSNFLSNAIKFTESGRVEVALESQGLLAGDDGRFGLGRERIGLRVTDSGIGIGIEAQQHLFQPFSQAEGDTTRRFGGTGLGLAICRRLAELMGGSVSMESVPGLGTTMRMTVVLDRADPAELPPEVGDARSAPGFSPRPLPTIIEAERERSLILLVDDHPTNRLVIARQLALAGYASEAAVDGQDGLERWRTGRFAMVLSDVHMPRLDGYALAGAIRAEENHSGAARTAIIALTASALKGEAERCLAAGMDDYLAKPVSVAALVNCIERWLPHLRAGNADGPQGAGLATSLAALRAANWTRPDAVATSRTPAGGSTSADRQRSVQRAETLDHDALAQLCGASHDEERAVLEDFLSSTHQDLANLAAARDAGDQAALTREAHKIKGASRMVGALDLAEAAAMLEAEARDGEWPSVLPLAAELVTAVQRLQSHITVRYGS